jgi:hypothetical protein
MTLLFLVALAGFLAILAYGTVTLGTIHGFLGALRENKTTGDAEVLARLEAMAAARRPWWRRLVG